MNSYFTFALEGCHTSVFITGDRAIDEIVAQPRATLRHKIFIVVGTEYDWQNLPNRLLWQ